MTLLSIVVAVLAPAFAAQSPLQQLGASTGVDVKPIAAQLQTLQQAPSAPTTSTQPKVSRKTEAAIVGAVRTLLGAGGLKWQESLPIGPRFVRVPLPELTPRYASDAPRYAALINVGALAPNAPVKDPNKADLFIVEVSGGFSGLSQYSQYIPMPARALTAEGDSASSADDTQAQYSSRPAGPFYGWTGSCAEAAALVAPRTMLTCHATGSGSTLQGTVTVPGPASLGTVVIISGGKVLSESD